MKVTTTINGTEIMIENDDYNEIIGFVNKISEKAKEEVKKKEIVLKERIESTSELSTTQFDLWNYVLDHDCEIGVHISALARHFDITDGAMSHRVMILTNRGFLYRVSRGRYRAQTP